MVRWKNIKEVERKEDRRTNHVRLLKGDGA